MAVPALGYTVTYGPGSFTNADGSTPTQEQVNAAFEQFRREIDRRNSTAEVEGIAMCYIKPGVKMPFDEPALAIVVVVPDNASSKQRVLVFTDDFAHYVNKKTSLKFDPRTRMIV